MKHLTGTLYEIAECGSGGRCNHHDLVFESFDGTVIEGVLNEANAPCAEIIEASFDGNLLLSYEESNIALTTDDNRKDIALIRYVAPGHGVKQEQMDLVIRMANRLKDWLLLINEANNYRWTHIDVTPYLLITNDMNSGPTAMNISDFENELRAQNPDKFDHHNYWHTWGGAVSGGANGLGQINGYKCWSSLAGDVDTVRHEQGHTLGCFHSSTPDYIYRPDLCTMGHGEQTGLCMPQYGRIKQYREEHIEVAENNKRYFLVPSEVNSNDVRSGEVKGLFIKEPNVPTGWIFLSARKSRNQSRLGAGSGTIVYLDETRTNFSYTPTDRGRISEGQSRVIGGLTVRNVGNEDGVIELEIGEAPPAPYPSLPPITPSDPLEPRHSGLWNNPDYSDQGLFLIVNGKNEARGFWYTHNPRGSRQSGLISLSSNYWFTLKGNINTDNIFNFEVSMSSNGESKKIGTGYLYIRNGVMIMRSYTSIFGRETLRLTQLTKDPTGPVLIHANKPDDGYTYGRFGNTHVAIHFTTGLKTELPWTIYMSEDPDNMNGYRVEGLYKAHYRESIEEVDSIGYEKDIAPLDIQFSSQD